MSSKNLLEFMQAARLLKKDGQTFNYYVNTGRIPVAEKNGNRRYFDVEALLAFKFIDKRKSKNPAKKTAVKKTKKVFTNQQILDVRKRLRNGEKQKYIALELGITPSTLSNILTQDACNG